MTEHISVETKNGFLYIVTPFGDEGTEPIRSGFPIKYENNVRRALNARRKLRKGTKPPKRFKAEPFLGGTVGTWIVKTIPECYVIATFPSRNGASTEADARAFAKIKNKQARSVTE